MNDDRELEIAVREEISALENMGAEMSFRFKPSEAFYLLSLLQTVLRYPEIALDTGVAGKVGRSIAKNIEDRLGRGRPAIAEAARRGWEQDTKPEVTECPQPVIGGEHGDKSRPAEETTATEHVRGSETKARTDAGKQGGRRTRK